MKFDQRTEDYNVFEFDCPAGLAFDEKTEVCVWPGSLPHASACSGSSEIAPVPQKRFTCPSVPGIHIGSFLNQTHIDFHVFPGYYADPENCRWFFACLDHGEPTMQAYEFRCPFGLVFDEERLLCEWPWLVTKCGVGLTVTQNYYGGISTNINRYDGLGVLQRVKLGGIQGPIHAAEAKTYSNVGFIGLTDKSLTDGRVFSENSARFIDASRRLGLSLKATQSLYNAGLLSEKLAAIGLSQNDFGLNNVASEVNLGLHQYSQASGQQLNGINLEQSGAQFGQQNQDYQYIGHNQNGLYSEQSKLENNGQVTLNSGSGLSTSFNGQHSANQALLEETGGKGSSISYNNLYQHSSSGGIQGKQAAYNQNAQNIYVNLDQSAQDQLQQNINLAQNSYAQFEQNKATLEHSRLNQASRGNTYSSSINTLGDTEGTLSLQKNIGLSQLNQGNNQFSSDGNVQYQQGYFGNSEENRQSQSFGNLAQTSEDKINLEISGLDKLNLGNSENYQGSSTIEGVSQNQEKYNSNLKTSGYSTSYFNSGGLSGSQFDVKQQGISNGQRKQEQLNSNEQMVQSENAQSGILRESQNVEPANIGVDVYRQNGEILLQNVEINGAAGTYINDHAQLNLNAGVDSSDFSYVTPASVSHTTANSFDAIVSATPLKTLDNYQQKQSVDTSGIEYSINGLAELKQSNKFDQTNEKATSYQFIQSQQPSFVSSTPSSVVLQQRPQKIANVELSDGISSIEYNNQPQVSINYPQTSGQINHEVHIKTETQPSISLQGISRESFTSAGEKGLLTGQSYSQDGGYNYEKPSVDFEDKPQVLISEKRIVSSTPSYVDKVVVTTSPATSFSYSNRVEGIKHQQLLKERPQVYVQQPQVVVSSSPASLISQSYSQNGGYNYEKPTVVFEEKPQILISEQRIVGSTPTYVDKLVVTPSSATRFSYSNSAEGIHRQERPQVYVQKPQVIVASSPVSGSSSNYFRQESSKSNYQNPQIIQQQPQISYELQQPVTISKKPEVTATSYNYISQNQPQILVKQPVISTGYNYEQPAVKSEILVEKPQVVLKKPEAFVSSYNYVKPTNIVYEQPKITVKHPVTVESYSYVKPSVNTEIVQEVKPDISQSFSFSQQNTRGSYIQRTPQIIQTTFQKPSVSTSLNIDTGYKYEKPSQLFEEGSKTVTQQIIQPVVQKQYNELNFQQPEVTSYQYFQPVVQQPRGFSKTTFQEEAVKTYSYSNPVRTQYVAKPATIVSTNYQIPVVKSKQIDFQGYGYPKPQVQFVEEPKGIITNYERKTPVVETPIIPKKAYVLGNNFQYQKIVPTIHLSSEGYSTPKPTFISTINSITSQKTSPSPQREFIYYDSRLDNRKQTNYFQTPRVEPARTPVISYTPSISQNVEVKGYRYPKPSIKFEEGPGTTQQQNYQYIQSHQVVNQVPIQVRPQISTYTTPRPTYVSTIQSIVRQKQEPLEFITNPPAQIHYLESTTLKPLSTVQPIEHSIGNVEINGYVDQKPQIQSYQYSQQTNAQQQKQVVVENFVNQQYDKPVYFSTERPTQAPMQKNTDNHEYFYYDSRLTNTQAPRVNYVETSTRAPIIQKKQRIEFQGYDYPKPQVSFEEPKVVTYENKVPVVELPVIPKKAYVTTGQEQTYNQNVNIQQETAKPIVLENYVSSNYQENTSNLQLKQVDYVTTRPTYISTISSIIEDKPSVNQVFTYSDSRYSSTPRTEVFSKTIETSSSRGYSYPKPKLQLLEEPGQVLNKVEINKEAQPIILENYVSPDYNKYDVSIQSSTPSTILSQYNKQEILRNDNRQGSEYVKATQAPVKLNLEVSSAAPVILQKLEQEQPVEPFYYYDSRLSSTQSPEVEIAQEKEQTPQVFRQEITSYDSRYSSTVRPAVNIPITRVVSQKTKTSSSRGYSYPKPEVQLLEEPQQVSNTVEVNRKSQPIILENYVSPDYNKYDVSFQSSTPNVILNQNVRQEVLSYNRQNSEYATVTEAPEKLKIEISTQAPVIVQKLEQEQPSFYYDNRVLSTVSPTVQVVQQKEEITGYGSRYSTVRPAIRIKSRPSVTIVKQEEPLKQIVVEQDKEDVQYREIETKEPSSTYLPIRKRIRVTKPSRKYLPTSTNPTVKYSSTTPLSISNEYLPVATSETVAEGGISVENYQNFELVRKKGRPVKVVKIVRPRVKTIVVKKNDFNPFLSAKLGAQCTCTSNTLELRKEPLRIEVSDEDYDDEVDGSILVDKKDGEAFVIENYESEKIDSSTAEPEIYIKSTTVGVPSSTFRLKKVNRSRSRAQNVVVEDVSSRRKSKVNIEASDVNINTSRLRIKTKKIDIVSDEEAEVNIESARSNSRLESVENVEISSKNFDRYGPGGLRSATETLQGIDCQRAGLFRHPTQCNKFYSCRWDCKKNKFTLHMFNCPVHLTFDNNLGACNWPSQGPACLENTLLPSE